MVFGARAVLATAAARSVARNRRRRALMERRAEAARRAGRDAF